MPDAQGLNDLVVAVAVDHEITAAELARMTGHHDSYIKRIFSGQYACPLSVTRALWRRTRDQRILDAALGVAEYEVFPAPDDEGIPDRILAAMTVVATGQVNQLVADHAVIHGSPRSSRELCSTIDNAMRRLMALKRRAMTPRTPLDRSA